MRKDGAKSGRNDFCAEIKISICARTVYELEGKIIKQLRLSRGWTQQSLGDRLGVCRDTVRRIENQGTQSGVQLREIARIFEVDIGVFGHDDKPTVH